MQSPYMSFAPPPTQQPFATAGQPQYTSRDVYVAGSTQQTYQPMGSPYAPMGMNGAPTQSMPAGVQSMPFPPQQQMYSSPQFMHPQQFASSPQPPPQFTSSQQFGAFPQQDGYVQKTPAPPAPTYGMTAVLTTSRHTKPHTSRLREGAVGTASAALAYPLA